MCLCLCVSRYARLLGRCIAALDACCCWIPAAGASCDRESQRETETETETETESGAAAGQGRHVKFAYNPLSSFIPTQAGSEEQVLIWLNHTHTHARTHTHTDNICACLCFTHTHTLSHTHTRARSLSRPLSCRVCCSGGDFCSGARRSGCRVRAGGCVRAADPTLVKPLHNGRERHAERDTGRDTGGQREPPW